MMYGWGTGDTTAAYIGDWYATSYTDKLEASPDHTEAREKRLACRRGWRERGVCRVARAGLPSRESRRVPQRRGR